MVVRICCEFTHLTGEVGAGTVLHGIIVTTIGWILGQDVVVPIRGRAAGAPLAVATALQTIVQGIRVGVRTHSGVTCRYKVPKANPRACYIDGLGVEHEGRGLAEMLPLNFK